MSKFFLFFYIAVEIAIGPALAYAAENQVIVAWGDSLTDGEFTNGFADELQNDVEENGRDVTVVNCGYGGELSDGSITRLARTLKCDAYFAGGGRGYCEVDDNYIWQACAGKDKDRTGWYTHLNGIRPDFILIWLGANDVIHGRSASTTAFNLEQMVNLSRQYRITPLLATLTPNGKYSWPNCKTDLTAYNDRIKTKARNLATPLADQCHTIPYWTNNHAGDLLHPNNIGDAQIARTWFHALPEVSDFPPDKDPPSVNGPLLLLLRHSP